MKNCLKAICFILIGVLILSFITRLFVLKDSDFDKYEVFNQLEKNSIDICYTGASRPDTSIIPQIIDDYNGCESFNYSVTGMRIEHLYYRMKDMLKTQKPSLLVIDTASINPVFEWHIEIVTRWAFDCLPLSYNKVNAINNLINVADRPAYYFNIIKYHDRVWEIQKEDWKKAAHLYTYPSTKGYKNLGNKSLERIDDYFLNDYSSITEQKEINESQKIYMDKIVTLAKENNISLLLITLPFINSMGMSAEENVKINNYLIKRYENEDIEFLDMNKMYTELGMDYQYFCDESHTNDQGAKVISNYLAKYIKKHYQFD